MSPVDLSPTRPSDLLAIARVFSEAFPDSLMHTWGRIPEPEFVAEPFRICLDAEPDAFWVARQDGEVVGYAFTPTNLSRVWQTAVTKGHLLRWVGYVLTGRYRLTWHPLRIVLANKWSFLSSALDRRFNVPARVLSIAVRPAYQGQGIATHLLQRAMAYFQQKGVTRVRLEVRPSNTPAVRAYQRAGFVAVGETGDSQGAWVIMIKEFKPDSSLRSE